MLRAEPYSTAVPGMMSVKLRYFEVYQVYNIRFYIHSRVIPCMYVGIREVGGGVSMLFRGRARGETETKRVIATKKSLTRS